MIDTNEIQKVLLPGDVISVESISKQKDLLMQIGYDIAIFGIRADQWWVFGPRSSFMTHHVMQFFDVEHTFSVQLPKPKWVRLEEYAKEKISIYRYNYVRSLNPSDICILRKACERIIDEGQDYDIPQLFDFLIATIAGYPFSNKIRWFDTGKGKMVCSVGLAAAHASFRHELLRKTGEDLPQPFKILNPKVWSKSFIEKFNKHGHWDINRTFPSNYTNCATHFANEYRFVATFEDLKRIK